MGGKQQWSNEHLKCLLETSIEEVNKVGKKGLSLHKDSWNKLGSVLKEKFGMDLTQKQMKNAYNNLKAKYIGWVYLRNKTGNIYNSQTNSFTLTAEEWEEFKKGHPKAAALKTHPLPYPDLCATLFDRNRASGNFKWTSTLTTSAVGSSLHRVQTLQIADNPYYDLEDDDSISHQTSDPTPDPSADPTPSASVVDVDPALSATADPASNTSPNVDRPGKRAKTSKPSINLDDLALDMQKALQYFVKGKDGPTVEECYDKLKLIELDLLILYF